MSKARRKRRKPLRRAKSRRTPAVSRSRKKAKRRPAPRIEYKPPPPIRMKEIVRWRKGGKWVKAETPGAQKYEYVAQISAKGKILRTIQQTTPHVITKFIAPGALDEDWESTGSGAPPSGHTQGFLRWQFQNANVMRSIHGAKRIEVTIKGHDTHEKTHRVKVVMEPESQKDLDKLLISRIITQMRAANVRTNYTLDILKAAKATGPLARRLSYQKFRSLEPLHNMEVIVTVHK